MDEWTDKENVVNTYSGTLLSLRKEGSSVICYNIDETGGHC